MKIRNGFVSNSSSSSFVVAFPKKPESAEEVQEMMFGSTEWEAFTCYDYETDTVQIAEQVFNDIKKATIKDMTKSLTCGWFSGRVDSWDKTRDLDWGNPKDRKKIDKIEKDCDEANEKIAGNIIKEFRKNNKGSFFAVFHYGDSDGEFFSIMEHGGIFDNLESIRTSYH